MLPKNEIGVDNNTELSVFPLQACIVLLREITIVRVLCVPTDVILFPNIFWPKWDQITCIPRGSRNISPASESSYSVKISFSATRALVSICNYYIYLINYFNIYTIIGLKILAGIIMMQDNFVLNGLFGLCVGDALGLPVQFASRIERKSNPVAEMTGYGVFNMPPGTWSDDSSLTFCLAESLCRGYDINDIAEKFIKWIDEGYWTPFDQAFDIGGSTSRAISRLKNGVSPHQSGDKGEINNGNGSLMRILPLAFYLRDADLGLQFEIAHEVSAITHAHTRSLIACGVYITIALELIRGCTLNTAYETMKKTVLQYYVHEPFISELKLFNRFIRSLNKGIADLVN